MPTDGRIYDRYVSTHTGATDEIASDIFAKRVVVPVLSARLNHARCRTVELAAGSGSLVHSMRALGFDSVGVDASREQVAEASRKWDDETLVQLGDAQSFLSELKEAPHAILAIDFLEHLSKPEVLSLLDQVKTVLAPGGVFIARVPNAESPFFGRLQFGDLSHQTCFNERSISQALMLAGFGEISIAPLNPIVHGVKSAVRALTWFVLSLFIKAAITAESGIAKGHVVTQNMLIVAVPERL